MAFFGGVGFWFVEAVAAVPGKSIRNGATVSDSVLVYKTALKLTPLMEILGRFRAKNT